MTRALPLLLLPLLLGACTGTEESAASPRLALLQDGGATLRGVTPAADNATPPVTEIPPVAVADGVDVLPLADGRRVALVRRGAVEARGPGLNDPQAFVAPNFPGGAACFVSAALSAPRDRVLVLSDCPNDAQRLALYRDSGALVWTATLPTFLPPVGGDTPPVRLAVLGDVGLVSRPRVGGGSEVLRVAQTDPTSTAATASDPVLTVAIRDLAPYGGAVLAATDRGVQRLSATGAPEEGAAGTLAAFGTARYERLWTGPSGTRTLLAAWRSEGPGGPSAQPLLVWDGAAATAATADTLTGLRDLTLTPDGFLSVLTAAGTLTRYDTLTGLAQNAWRPRTLLTGIPNPVALAWVVPPAP